MKARLLKVSKMKDLRAHIAHNLELYRSGNFDGLRDDPSNFIETELEIDESRLDAIDCDADDHKEVECCIASYEAMGALSHYLARDERLWVNLCHTNLLAYSRKRWPIPDDADKAVLHIQNHFFVVGARGFERDNSAARLWWMASLCKRVKGLSLQQALTCLLHQYDVRANIIERPTTSQSASVFSVILNRLDDSFKGDKALFERERFRSVMKELNLRGGVRLLGALSDKELKSVLDQCIKATAPATKVA